MADDDGAPLGTVMMVAAMMVGGQVSCARLMVKVGVRGRALDHQRGAAY